MSSLFLTFLNPNFLFFAPILAYDILKEKYQASLVILILPLIKHYKHISSITVIQLFILLAVAYIIKNLTCKFTILQRNYFKLRDEAIELSNDLKYKNNELLEKQDYEITMATLNERNRIAGEIHDNIGHLLSSAILQIGALMTISKDSYIKENLTQIKNTLSTGMDSIRNSIHNIHEKSINLQMKLEELVQNFTFCSAFLEYHIDTDLTLKAKYSVLFIVKEAFSNTMKHSNASQLHLTLREHPSFYQLILMDNGSKINPYINSKDGMGVNNIFKRVEELNGHMNITTENGFKIFISFPKGGSKS